MKKINGVEVKKSRVFAEAGLWRWQIVDVDGREFVDGGNYQSKTEAQSGLADAFDRGAGRPAKDPAHKRRHFSTTIAPETMAKIEADKKPGESVGDVLDRWGKDR